jgi:hypothetical protein
MLTVSEVRSFVHNESDPLLSAQAFEQRFNLRPDAA